MRNIIMIILFMPFPAYPQIFENFPKALSVELGANYPTLNWKINKGGEGNGDRKELWIQPSIRVLYDIPLYNNFFAKPFIGYYHFGGKSAENNYGYQDKIVFSAIEVGTGLLYIINNFEFGVGLKWNNHLKVIQQRYGYFNTNYSSRQWEEEDISYFFKKSSFDWGLRASYLFIYNFNISVEYWTSLNDIESNNLSQYINVRNNTLKIGIGYNF